MQAEGNIAFPGMSDFGRIPEMHTTFKAWYSTKGAEINHEVQMGRVAQGQPATFSRGLSPATLQVSAK